jgi:hypothetical protein
MAAQLNKDACPLFTQRYRAKAIADLIRKGHRATSPQAASTASQTE